MFKIKKYIKIFLAILSLIFLVGCSNINTPDELKQFSKNTNETYWSIAATKSGFYIVINSNDIQKSFDTSFYKDIVPDNYEDFLYSVWKITIYDNRVEDHVISWRKHKTLNSSFIGPNKNKIISFPEIKRYFSIERNTLSLAIDTIKDFEKIIKKMNQV